MTLIISGYGIGMTSDLLLIPPVLVDCLHHRLEIFQFRVIRAGAGRQDIAAVLPYRLDQVAAVFLHFLRRAGNDEGSRHVARDAAFLAQRFFRLDHVRLVEEPGYAAFGEPADVIEPRVERPLREQVLDKPFLDKGVHAPLQARPVKLVELRL